MMSEGRDWGLDKVPVEFIVVRAAGTDPGSGGGGGDGFMGIGTKGRASMLREGSGRSCKIEVGTEPDGWKFRVIPSGRIE